MKQLLSLVALLVATVEGANILVVLPVPWFSHTNTFMPVFKQLALRGHNVTMVSPFPQEQPLPNWTDLTVNASVFKRVFASVDFVGVSQYTFYPKFWRFFIDLMEAAFEDQAIQQIIKAEDSQYDAVIIEPFYGLEPLVALGHKFNAPVIGVHALSLTPWQAFLTGNEVSFHLLPNIRSSYSNDMSFFERLDNTLVNLIEFSFAYFDYLPKKESQMNKHMLYDGSENRPSILEMLRNVSLTMIDYHCSILYAEPLQPNTIPVGGLSLLNVGDLPKDLKEIIANSEKGVILLSFGSILQGSELGETVFKLLLEAFSQLEQTIIMKWNIEDVANKPKNVHLRNWLPQPSILAHPNVRLFITHAGLHGIVEGAFFGVPLLCIPLFSDQPYDAKFVEKIGYGTTLLLKDLTKDNLLNSIHEVLNDQRYTRIAQERSEILKGRPQKALEDAVFWIEHVLKHKGPGYLKPARLQLSLYEILGLDILLFCVLLSLTLSFITFKCLGLLLSRGKVKTKKD